MSNVDQFQLGRKPWRARLITGSVILGFSVFLIGGYQLFLGVQKAREAAHRSSDL